MKQGAARRWPQSQPRGVIAAPNGQKTTTALLDALAVSRVYLDRGRSCSRAVAREKVSGYRYLARPAGSASRSLLALAWGGLLGLPWSACGQATKSEFCALVGGVLGAFLGHEAERLLG